MGWLVYVGLMLAMSGLAGRHVGRFRESCGGMLGMMVGMTMGMMTGFVLGYGAAAATNSMGWGNAFGMLLGLTLGVYYGRSAGLMGMMDGGMGGVMGGSMGAMLAVMIRLPNEALIWTAVLLTALFLLSMVALGALVEQHSPERSELHLLLPLFEHFSPAYAPGEAAAQPHTSVRRQYRGRSEDERDGLSKGALLVGIAGGLLLLIALALKLLTPAPAASIPIIGHDPNDPLVRAVSAPLAADGRQTQDLVINGDTMSYRPGAIKVKKGVPVRLNLSTEGRDPGCGRLVMIYDVGASGSATPGQVTPLDFTPTSAGTYEINCGMKMMEPAYLVVTN